MGATFLYNLPNLPSELHLHDKGISLELCHRIGLSPLPLYQAFAAHHDLCGPKCKTISEASPLSQHPDLAYTQQHCYHLLVCGCDSCRIRKHNSLCQHTATSLAPEASFDADLRTNLGSSATAFTKIDLNLTSYARDPPTTSIDFTVSCALLPTYLTHTQRDAGHIFVVRATEKINKHMAGCLALGRAFIPGVFTTQGGVGPKQFVVFVDRVYSDAAALEILAGGRGRLAQHRRQLFYAGCHVIIIRSNEATLHRRYSAPRRRRPRAAADSQESQESVDETEEGGEESGEEGSDLDDGMRPPAAETFGETRGEEDDE